ncbi:transposase [Methylorubrum aminovorans]|nr:MULTISPECIES: transposase [unclassified Methylobacterium]QIJ74159.1 transposase [Methylobacterium sp. CLZ]QIJ79063.1 transposase [Methylobacterium sp. NI91]
MPKTRPSYPAEFRRQMVDRVRVGRNPTDLAREFEPSRQTIQNWVAEADRGEGCREAKPPTVVPSLTATECDEFVWLRRENRQLKLERDILPRATAWFARETGACRRGFQFMSANQADLPIVAMACVLGVSKAGCYAWASRQPSVWAVADAALLKRIRTVHLSSRQTCGAPHIHADLRDRSLEPIGPPAEAEVRYHANAGGRALAF